MDLSRRPVELAVALAGAQAVIVGSTAQLLRDGVGRPRDLDLAVAPAQVPALVDGLAVLGSSLDPAALARTGQVRVDTFLGPVDVFVRTHPAWREVPVAGALLRVTP